VGQRDLLGDPPHASTGSIRQCVGQGLTTSMIDSPLPCCCTANALPIARRTRRMPSWESIATRSA
jgi:hypothetical protein